MDVFESGCGWAFRSQKVYPMDTIASVSELIFEMSSPSESNESLNFLRDSDPRLVEVVELDAEVMGIMPAIQSQPNTKPLPRDQ